MGYSHDDDRIIKAAVKAGKISGDYLVMWQHAMVADRAGTRRTLAELPPGWAATDPVRTARIVALGSGKTVAAASPEAIANERAVLDSVGLPMPDAPRAHVISKGKDPQTWTREEQARYYSHKLGGPFAIGVPKPPAGDQIYIDSPTAPYRWDAASQQFVERNPYREI
jgi:hypothetical protein